MSENKPLEKKAVLPLVAAAGAVLWKGLMLALAAYSAKGAGEAFGQAAGNFDAGNTARGLEDVGMGALSSLGMLPGVGIVGQGLKGLGTAANAARTGNLVIKATQGATALDLQAIRIANTMLRNPTGLKLLQKISPSLVGRTGEGMRQAVSIFNKTPARVTIGTAVVGSGIPEALRNRGVRKSLNKVNDIMQGSVPFAPVEDVRPLFGIAPKFIGYGSYMPQPTPHIYREGQSMGDTVRQLRNSLRDQGISGPVTAPRTAPEALKRLQASNLALGRTATGGSRWAPMIEKIENFLIQSQVDPQPAGPASVFGGKFDLDTGKLFKPAVKTSQDYSMLSYQPGLQNRTLEDLYAAIRSDMSLDPVTKAQLVSQVRGMTGMASPGTPLSALMMKGLGGALGFLLSKYFGLSPMGQLVSTVAGYGLGSALNNYLNKPPDPYPGYRMLV
jgi:hypothetical protein